MASLLGLVTAMVVLYPIIEVVAWCLQHRIWIDSSDFLQDPFHDVIWATILEWVPFKFNSPIIPGM